MQKHIRIFLKHNNLKSLENVKCEECGEQAEEIHHIIPRSIASKDNVNKIENLQALCKQCHKKKHNKNEHKTSYKKMGSRTYIASISKQFD